MIDWLNLSILIFVTHTHAQKANKMIFNYKTIVNLIKVKSITKQQHKSLKSTIQFWLEIPHPLCFLWFDNPARRWIFFLKNLEFS